MAGAAQVPQRGNDPGWLQPRGMIRVEIGKHDEACIVEEVGGGYRQHPTFGSVPRRMGVAQRQVSSPVLVRNGEGDAIAGGDFTSEILQYRKRPFTVGAGRERITLSLRRKSD